MCRELTPSPIDYMQIENLIGMYLNSCGVSDFIEQIGDAPEDDFFAGMQILNFFRRGVMLYVGGDDVVISVQMHAEGHDGYSEFQGQLPLGLRFNDSDKDVFDRIGPSNSSGIKSETKESWERFDYKNYSLHVLFSPDRESIRQVSLLAPKLAAGRLE